VGRDFFVRDTQRDTVIERAFLKQESGKSFVEAFPHDLFYEPHNFRKTGGHQFIREIRGSRVAVHQLLVNGGRDHVQLGILLRFDRDVELDIFHDTGRRKQADIPFQKTVDRNLSSFVGTDKGAELTATHDDQPDAVRRAIVEQSTLRRAAKFRRFPERRPPFLIQFIPYREVIFQLH